MWKNQKQQNFSQDNDHLEWIVSYLPREWTSITCDVSVPKNDIKCKFIFVFPGKIIKHVKDYVAIL